MILMEQTVVKLVKIILLSDDFMFCQLVLLHAISRLFFFSNYCIKILLGQR